MSESRRGYGGISENNTENVFWKNWRSMTLYYFIVHEILTGIFLRSWRATWTVNKLCLLGVIDFLQFEDALSGIEILGWNNGHYVGHDCMTTLGLFSITGEVAVLNVAGEAWVRRYYMQFFIWWCIGISLMLFDRGHLFLRWTLLTRWRP